LPAGSLPHVGALPTLRSDETVGRFHPRFVVNLSMHLSKLSQLSSMFAYDRAVSRLSSAALPNYRLQGTSISSERVVSGWDQAFPPSGALLIWSPLRQKHMIPLTHTYPPYTVQVISQHGSGKNGATHNSASLWPPERNPRAHSVSYLLLTMADLPIVHRYYSLCP